MKPMIGRCLGVLMLVAVPASAADATNPATPREGRGLVFGVGLGPGRISFGGAQSLVLVIGGPTGTLTFPYGGGTIELRAGEVVSRSLVPVGAEGVVPIPSVQNGVGGSLHFGWSFSRRFAALLDFDVVGSWDNGFDQLVGGPVARYSPTSRLWIEAGPAFGEVRYALADSVVEDVAGRGSGVLVGAGVAIVRKPTWLLDVEARVATLWYDKLRATNLSAQLAVSRRRS
jgi:hypothetical protein